MMRKDVKLGFAIGGVLLAVLVVYVLVGTGNDKTPPGTATVVTQDNPTDNKVASATPSHEAAHDSSGQVTSNLSDKLQDPKSAKPDAAVAGKNAGKDPWGTVLNEGHMLLTETPDTSNGKIDTGKPDAMTDGAKTDGGNSAGTSSDVPGGGGARDAHERDPSRRANGSTDGMIPDRASDSSGPTTQPSRGTSAANGSQRTHVIQKGETFASISQMAYGSASYVAAIQRANSNLDPKKLRPGTSIVLPAIGDVKPGSKSSPSLGTSLASTTDPKTEYRVEAGDTLERIAVKLYGKREMKDKLYELNKDSIGADPNKLKLNQVLKLPSPHKFEREFELSAPGNKRVAN